ncbi:MAG: hypothetical protein NT098_02845 [Candidatus Parcubacteria bacterium]|nr:hypothetical protein [Candidatus Parcubacteria bacterium]
MKNFIKENWFKVIIVFSCVYFLPTVTFAISGACSYHGGVNCSIGPSITGMVTCNDGWVNSNVLFSNTDECMVVDSCPGIYLGTCTTEADYARMQQQVDSMRGRTRALNSAQGILGSPMDQSSSIGQDQLDSCRKDIDGYNAQVRAQDQCYSRKIQIATQQQTQTLDNWCHYKSDKGLYSHYDEASKQCVCQNGYTVNGVTGQCVIAPQKSYDQMCKDGFGINSEWNGTYRASNGVNTPGCICSAGYDWNSDGTDSCVPVPIKDKTTVTTTSSGIPDNLKKFISTASPSISLDLGKKKEKPTPNLAVTHQAVSIQKPIVKEVKSVAEITKQSTSAPTVKKQKNLLQRIWEGFRGWF